MLEAHLNVASFTCAGVGKRQNLPATLDGTNWFLLLGRVTITRLEVLLQDCLLVLSHMAGGLDGHGTCFANNNLSAVVVGFQARVGLVGSVFQTKDLLATVAGERKKIELVAIAVLAVFTQIWKSFCSTRCHGYS